MWGSALEGIDESLCEFPDVRAAVVRASEVGPAVVGTSVVGPAVVETSVVGPAVERGAVPEIKVSFNFFFASNAA